MPYFQVITKGYPALLVRAETEAQIQEAVTATGSTYTKAVRYRLPQHADLLRTRLLNRQCFQSPEGEA